MVQKEVAINKTVWVYWEGDRKPLIDLCIQSIQRHNPVCCVLDQHGLRKLGGDSVLAATKGKPLWLRADLARLWLLQRFGGGWIDADCIALKAFDMIDHLDGWDFVGFGNDPPLSPRISNAVLASRANGVIVGKAFTRAMRSVRSPRKDRFGHIGQSMLRPLWVHNSKIFKRCERWRYAYVHWTRVDEFWRKDRPDDEWQRQAIWNPNACLYHMTGKAIGKFGKQTRDQLMHGNTFTSFLLRQAFA